jgi:hypothetical protein
MVGHGRPVHAQMSCGGGCVGRLRMNDGEFRFGKLVVRCGLRLQGVVLVGGVGRMSDPQRCGQPATHRRREASLYC